MSLELLNTLAAVGTFAVISATAIAATVQLRHLRRNNQLQAVLMLRRERDTKKLDEAFEFVSTELEAKLRDPDFRAELEGGLPSRNVHRELVLADYFEHVGTYTKLGLVDEDIYFEVGNPSRYWMLCAPAIAVYRRTHGLRAYENFEYLVVREKEWDRRHPDGPFSSGVRRIEMPDPHLADDRRHAKIADVAETNGGRTP